LIIRDRILKGEFRLGAPLSRRKLAAELSMSLLPVGEALQHLENDGLVQSRPRVGTRVFLPTAEDIREHYEVREALESQAARLFATRAGKREQLELMRTSETMDAMFARCAGGVASPEYLFSVQTYHARLHLRIAECTGCRALHRTIERNHVLIFNWLFDVAASRPPLPPRFHRDLATALCLGDPTVADQSMREHIRFGLGNIVHAIGPGESGRLSTA
jgi:DNA-binding GntR family transcriptional regulator